MKNKQSQNQNDAYRVYAKAEFDKIDFDKKGII